MSDESLVRLDTFMLRHLPDSPFKNSFNPGDKVNTPLGTGVIRRMEWCEPDGSSMPRLDVWIALSEQPS